MYSNQPDQDNVLMVYVISDSIGETGELIAKASVKQFDTTEFMIKRFPYTNTVDQIKPLLEEAAQHKKSIGGLHQCGRGNESLH